MSTRTPEKATVLTVPKDINDVIKNAENNIESIEHIKTEMDKLKIEETQSQLIDLSVDNQKANTDNHNLNTKIDCAKEQIYATPLRKLDRPKVKAQTVTNHDTQKPNNTDDMNGTTEDRHILNFLKDTSKLQKKLQRSGCGSGNNSSGDSDYGKANFSSLAQEQHFVNLVQQNVIGYSETATHETDSTNNDDEPTNKVETAIAIGADSKLVPANGTTENNIPKISDVFIKREWIIKLIALCLEQRLSKQSKLSAVALGDEAAGESHKKSGSSRMQQKSAAQYTGVFLLGSNGSGKTAICQRIINGNTGTQGMLNRRLLCCYFINTQNAECHSLSTFIRCIVMQILSHSTLLCTKDDAEKANVSKTSNDTSTDTSTAALDTTLMDTTSLVQPNEGVKNETKATDVDKESTETQEKTTKTPIIIRQKSETNKNGSKSNNRDSIYDTYPPSQKTTETKPTEQNQCYTPTKTRTSRATSKIPVKIGNKSSSPSISATKDTPNTSPAKKTTENKLNSHVTEKNETNNDDDNIIQYENIEIHKKTDEPKTAEKLEEKPTEKEDMPNENDHPAPPPKNKSVREIFSSSILL